MFVCHLYIFLGEVSDQIFRLIFFKNSNTFFFFLFGLRCCVWAFSSCGERGLLFVAVHGLLIAVGSLVQSMGSRHMDFSSCGAWA